MSRKISNRRAQFFIASAIIIIIVMYFIFFNVLQHDEPSYSNVELADFTYTLSNIEDEYGSIVEVTLANVSKTAGASANDALDDNLSYFTDFLENLTAEQSIVAVISAARQSANTSFMNASVNLTLRGVNTEVVSSFNAVRELDLDITQIVACDQNPPGASNELDFRARVLKEYSEPIVGLGQGDFGGIVLNGVDYSMTTVTGFSDEGGGVYLFETSTPCAGGQNLVFNLTDLRTIFVEATTTT